MDWFRQLSAKSGPDLVDDIDWLYSKYSSCMYRLAIFITGSADDAEDAVADVFARLSTKRQTLRTDVDPKAYLLSAVRNACYSILRGRKRRAELSDSAMCYLSHAEYHGVTDAQLDAAEVMRCLALLPAAQREIVALKTLEQLTFAEIAKMAGESINTIASRYRSAITSLRKLLEDENERASD